MKKILFYSLLILLVFFCGCNDRKAVYTPEDDSATDSRKSDEEMLEIFVEECEGIYEASDGNLISVYPPHDESEYTEDFETVKNFANDCSLPVYVAFPPRKMDALTNSLPNDFPTGHTKKIYSLAEDIISQSDAVYIDLYSVLEGKSQAAGDLYYMTDHHWTIRGAWLAYTEIAEKIGIESLPFESFSTLILSQSWQGSDFTKKPSSLSKDIFTAPVGEGFVVEIANSQGEIYRSFEGFLDFDAQNPDEILLGGNNPYVKIKKNDEKREVLVIVRDSFANALAPFLAEHFDLVLIDPRFFSGEISSVAESEDAFGVLILENLGSVTEHSIKFRW